MEFRRVLFRSCDAPRRVHGGLLALDHAGSRDQDRPLPRPAPKLSEIDFVRHSLRLYLVFTRCSNRLFNEAAGDDKTGGIVSGYVEDLVEPRTKLRACFSISA